MSGEDGPRTPPHRGFWNKQQRIVDETAVSVIKHLAQMHSMYLQVLFYLIFLKCKVCLLSSYQMQTEISAQI